jgi:hypothetical protein
MRNPTKCLPIVRESLSDLLDIASAVQQRQLEFRDDDHFGWMLFVFFAKQTEHARGVLALTEKGLYRDAGLLARSMMEGLVQLLWACNDPGARALAWKEFTCVSSWRKIMKDQQGGHPVAAAVRAQIEEARLNHGQQFLTKKGLEHLKSGEELSSRDYFENWTGHSYAEVFEQVKAQSLRLLPYSQLSDWHHWSPEIMAEVVHIDDESGRITYLEPSARSGALALANAFQALFQTLEHVDAHFGLNAGQGLNGLKEAYAARLGEIQTNNTDAIAPGKP